MEKSFFNKIAIIINVQLSEGIKNTRDAQLLQFKIEKLDVRTRYLNIVNILFCSK